MAEYLAPERALLTLRNDFCRAYVALARKAQRSVSLGQSLTNLAGVLTECGQLDEALSAAREGLPLRIEFGFGWVPLDHLALRAGLAGQIARAARLAGFADCAWATREATRQPNEARARERLHALLRDKLPPDELTQLFGEGAKLSEDEACRLALAD